MGSALLLHNLDFLLISLLGALCLVSPFMLFDLICSLILKHTCMYICKPDDAEDAGGDAVRALAAADCRRAAEQLFAAAAQMYKCFFFVCLQRGERGATCSETRTTCCPFRNFHSVNPLSRTRSPGPADVVRSLLVIRRCAQEVELFANFMMKCLRVEAETAPPLPPIPSGGMVEAGGQMSKPCRIQPCTILTACDIQVTSRNCALPANAV